MSEDSSVGPLSQRVPVAANRPTPSMRIAPPVLPESLLERLRAELGTSREEQAGPEQSGSAGPSVARPEGEPGRADGPRRLAWARRRDRTTEPDRTSQSDRAAVNVATAAAAGRKQAELHTVPPGATPNPLRRRTPADANVPKLPMRPAAASAPHTGAVFDPGPEPGAMTQPIPVMPAPVRDEAAAPVAGQLRSQSDQRTPPDRVTQPDRTVERGPSTQPDAKNQPVHRAQPDPTTQPDAKTQPVRAEVSVVTAAALGRRRAEMQTLAAPPFTPAAPPRRSQVEASVADAPTQTMRLTIAVPPAPDSGPATQPIPTVPATAAQPIPAAGAVTQPIPAVSGPARREIVSPAADVPRVRADRISLPDRSVEPDRDTGPDGRTQPERPPETAVPLDQKAALDQEGLRDQAAAPDHEPSAAPPKQAERGRRPAPKRPLASVPTGSAAPRVNPELMMRPLFADSETLEEVIVSLRGQAAQRKSPAARRYRVFGVVISVLLLVVVIVLIA
jgi:hypothetical protein